MLIVLNDFTQVPVLTQFGENGLVTYTSGFAESSSHNYKSHFIFRPYLFLLVIYHPFILRSITISMISIYVFL